MTRSGVYGPGPPSVRSPARVTPGVRPTRSVPGQPREVVVIGFVIAGLVIGALARLLRPGEQRLGLWATLLLGLAGSVAGGTAASLLGNVGLWELDVLGLVVAVVVAVALVGFAEAVSDSRAPLEGLEDRHDRPTPPASAARNEEVR